MITIEKDLKAEEIFIHGTPESLREFAKKIWFIAEKAELKGKYKEQLSTKNGSDPELSSKLQGEAGKYCVVKKMTLAGRS